MSVCSWVTLAGTHLGTVCGGTHLGTVCGGGTRTTADGLCYSGLKRRKVWFVPMERRLGRRVGERSVGNVFCGIHRPTSGRQGHLLIRYTLFCTCWRRVGGREISQSLSHPGWCGRLSMGYTELWAPYVILHI